MGVSMAVMAAAAVVRGAAVVMMVTAATVRMVAAPVMVAAMAVVIAAPIVMMTTTAPVRMVAGLRTRVAGIHFLIAASAVVRALAVCADFGLFHANFRFRNGVFVK